MQAEYKHDAEQADFVYWMTKQRKTARHECRVQDAKRADFAYWMAKQHTPGAYDVHRMLLLHTTGPLARYIQSD